MSIFIATVIRADSRHIADSHIQTAAFATKSGAAWWILRTLADEGCFSSYDNDGDETPECEYAADAALKDPAFDAPALNLFVTKYGDSWRGESWNYYITETRVK